MALISPGRKLILVGAVCVLVVGWLLYLIGFCWELFVWTGEVDKSKESPGAAAMSRSNSSLFPYYISLVGVPFLCTFEVLHALLPGVASCIFGSISAFVSTIYFMSVGDVAFRGGANITTTLYERSQFPYPDISVSPRVTLRFSGVIIEGLSWVIVLMVSPFYKYRSAEYVYHHVKWPLSLGYVRITSVACIALSAIGWCVYIVGDHSLDSYKLMRGLYSVSEAGTFFVPPLLFVAALLHALCVGHASSVIGAFVSILHMLFTVFMGTVVIKYSLAIHEYPGCFQDNCIAVKQILGGSVASLFFWILSLSLRPFYRQKPSGMSTDSSQQHVDMVHNDEERYATQPLIQNM